MKRTACWGCGLVAICVWSATLLGAPPRDVHPVGYAGRVWYGDGCGCEAACDPCWDPCRPHCCLGLVPAVVRGVDRILYSLFAGFRCGHPCGASCGVPGCWDCHGGVELPEGIPMPEPMPPEPQMGRMYIPRSPARSPVQEEFWLGGGSVYRESAYRGTARPRSAPRPGSTAPSRSVRATSADEPASGQLKRAEQAVELLPVETPLRRVSFENLPPRESRTTLPSIPHNPLRD